MLVQRIPADVAGADPVAAPADVPDRALFRVPLSQGNSDDRVARVFLSSESGGTLTVQLYALEERTEPQLTGSPAKADRVWHAVGSSTAAAVRALSAVVEVLPGAGEVPLRPPAGLLYARVTAGAGAGRVLVVSLA